MSRKSEIVKKQAAKLDPDDRADLAMSLIESLDPGRDEDTSEIWLTEAATRLRGYDAGEFDSAPLEDVLISVREKIP